MIVPPRAALTVTLALSACAPVEAPRPPPPPTPIAAPAIASPAVTTEPAPQPPHVPEAPPWPPPPPGIHSPYCLDGVVETLAEDACYVLPDHPTRALLIYLPGLMPPVEPKAPGHSEQRAAEAVVAAACRRAGVAALVPRGMTRDALVAPGRDDKGMGHYFSWPTGDEAYRRHALALVERIEARRRDLEALVGARFERVFLGGSSAGAYFAAHLALRGDFPADGYLIASGGSARPSPRLASLPHRPLYVGFGDGDLVGPRAEELAKEARSAGWDVRVSVHHTGHGSREVYLDEAFAFFGVTGHRERWNAGP